MPVPPVSPYNVVLGPQDVNPRLQTEQHALVAALGEPVRRSLDKGKSDSVVISKKAATRAREGEEVTEAHRDDPDAAGGVECRPDGTYHPRGR